MDPATFTQKLLERTQARKEALRQKNEEFNAFRSKHNTPSGLSPAKPPRRPLTEDNNKRDLPSAPSPVKQPRSLSEDNSNGGIKDESSRRRIASDNSVSKTPTKVTVMAKVPTTPRGITAKLKYSDQNPATPASISKARAGLEIDGTGSPSIRARKEQLILMQQKDQESVTTPKKHWKKTLDVNPTENKSPSVAARSAIFENSKEKTAAVTTATPNKLSTKRDVFEKSNQQNSSETKAPSTAPPKPPRTTLEERTLHREKSSTKRKAPPPPVEPTNGVSKSRSEEAGCDQSVVSACKSSEEVPSKRERTFEKEATTKKPVRTTVDVVMEAVPKPRKRTQLEELKVDTIDKEWDNHNLQELEEMERRMEERKKARMERRGKGEVAVTAQAEEKTSSRSAPVIHVAEVSSPRKAPPRPKARVEVVSDTVDGRKKPEKNQTENNPKRAEQKAKVIAESNTFGNEKQVKKQKPVREENNSKPSEQNSELKQEKQVSEQAKQVLDRNGSSMTEKKDEPSPMDKPVLDKDSARIAEKKKEVQSMIKRASSTYLPRYGSFGDVHAGMDDDLNETVNLNDVNIHEMTFTFDFSNFDKIQEDRETKFQKSFNEAQQELDKEKKVISAEVEKVKIIAHQPKPTANVDEKNNGVFKSGYSMEADDKYATKVYKKEKPPVPERPKPVQEKIKELLDQAASHQNIILQTSQALNVCETNNDIFKGSQEEIEAERVLLLASERKQACLNEQYRLKSGRKDSKRSHLVDPKACSSTVSLSGIRLSLKQEFMDVLRCGIRNDLGLFQFVCHVQHGPLEITSTKAVSILDCTDGNYLIFPDKFVMRDLNPDFHIVVRVFGMHVEKYNPHAVNTGQKHKLFQSPKTPKNKRGVPDGTSPRGGAETLPVFRTTNFKLLGSACINLNNINSKKWSLDGLAAEGCPLKDTINMKISCLPHYTSCVKGFLTILEDVGGYSAWQRRWCILEGGVLSYWRYPGDEAEKAPMGSLDIGQCTSERITTVPRDLCARPNTIELAMKKDKEEDYKFLLACDTKEDRITWLDCLNDALTDMKAWNSKKSKKAAYPELNDDKKVHMC